MKTNKTLGVLLWVFLAISYMSNAQVRIQVVELPLHSPVEPIFITGSFNDWNPADSNYQLQRGADGLMNITLPKSFTAFEYKFTRGSWETVEGTLDGKPLANRVFISLKADADTAFTVSVASWEDLADQTTFLITNLPDYTPEDAKIFISGSFNDWVPDDENYRLVKNADGQYTITLPSALDSFSYKFTRGSWNSVEGKRNGMAKTNRRYVKLSNDPETVKVDIISWEDFKANGVTYYSFLLMLFAGQGIIVISVLGQRVFSGRYSAYWLGFLSFLVMGVAVKGAAFDKSIFDNFAQLLLLPDIFLLLAIPFYVFGVKSLLFPNNKKKTVDYLWIAPAIIVALVYIPLMSVTSGEFIYGIVNYEFQFLFDLVSVFGILFLSFAWNKCRGIIQQGTKNSNGSTIFQQKLQVLNWFQQYFLISILFSFAIIFVRVFAYFLLIDISVVSELMVDVLWVAYAFIPVLFVYVLVNYPEAFRNYKSKKETRYKDSSTVIKDIDLFKEKVRASLEKEKVYLNAQLTLQDLATHIGTNTSTLSRTINEGFEKSFTDLVNSYRVREFVKYVEMEGTNDDTFLSIALKVGFSSKTTFNRAFKKVMDKTPREYFSMNRNEI